MCLVCSSGSLRCGECIQPRGRSLRPTLASPVGRTEKYAGTPTIGNARSLSFPFHSLGAMEAGWCLVERRPPVPGRSELQAHDATVLQSLAAEVREGLGRSPGCYSGSSGAVALCNGRRVGSGARTGAACAKRRGLSMAGGRRAAELPRACRLPGRKRRGPRSAPDAKRDGADRRRTGKAGRDRRGAATAASISSNFAPVLSDCLLVLARIFVPSTTPVLRSRRRRRFVAAGRRESQFTKGNYGSFA